MKNPVFLLLALFAWATCGAQAITRDTLLGEWSLRKISMQGNIADLKTGQIEVSDAFAAEKGQSKEALAEQFKTRLPGMKGSLFFYTDNRMEYQIGGRQISQGSYIIVNDNNKQYLADEYSGSRMEAYFKDNLLYWEVLSNDGLVIMAWERVL